VAAPPSLGGSLQTHGVRMTRQRKLLFELIDGSGAHLNAETLYRLAKERDSRINRVTVYRTLKLLKQEGLVDELDLLHHEGDQHYYETRLKREHAHVVCLRCGRVEEFFGEPLKRLKQQIEAHFGFQIMIARTEVGGYCADCQRQAVREAQQLRSEPIAVNPKSPGREHKSKRSR
jgi:Fur family ferric uptake transcriptional regulator